MLPFKAALHLELKRRENDAKVIALHFMMTEMMATLLMCVHRRFYSKWTVEILDPVWKTSVLETMRTSQPI